MKSEIKRVLELQISHSADNTPEMQERGALIRGPIRDSILALKGVLSSALGRFGGSFVVEASDGTGRKTELPWVRFASSAMSPRPTEGFYVVLHFSTNGSSFHITIGCGSSRFVNGSFVEVPASELKRQVDWARSVIQRENGSLAPFDDPIGFGATRSLPKSFERATACAKTIAFVDIDRTDITAILVEAAKRLSGVYGAQAQGNNLPASDQEEEAVTTAASPSKSGRRGQGYGLTAQQRMAVDRRAMAEAMDWLGKHGYSAVDVSNKESFDILATSGTETVKVEVKGTTSVLADAILMTANEVALHTIEKGKTALIIVSDIRLASVLGTDVADGGKIEALIGWDIGSWSLEPIAFRLRR